MGLDGVELVMECEREFGIYLPDEPVSQVRTMADLHALVVRCLQQRPASVPCESSHVFYRLRASLAACGADRRLILPTSRLDDVLPSAQRRTLWTQLANATALHLPALRRPFWLVLLIVCAMLATAGVVHGLLPSPVLAGLGGITVGLALVALTRSMAIHWPDHCATMAGLVRDVAERNHSVLRPQDQFTEDQVWQELVQIVSEQMAVAPAKLRPQTRFIEDLHMG